MACVKEEGNVPPAHVPSGLTQMLCVFTPASSPTGPVSEAAAHVLGDLLGDLCGPCARHARPWCQRALSTMSHAVGTCSAWKLPRERETCSHTLQGHLVPPASGGLGRDTETTALRTTHSQLLALPLPSRPGPVQGQDGQLDKISPSFSPAGTHTTGVG